MLFQRTLKSRHESAYSTAQKRQLKSVKQKKLKSKDGYARSKQEAIWGNHVVKPEER